MSDSASVPSTTSPTSCWMAMAGRVACMTAAIAASAAFLPHRGLWNDEATQMDGITLGPIEVTRWLAGYTQYDFGVPPDRMPPLSYWLGCLWTQIIGFSESNMRWLGVMYVAAATCVIYQIAHRLWGFSSAILAGLLMALSPNVVTQAVEIRAYSLLILMSSCVYYCLFRLLSAPETGRIRWLTALVICGTAAAYSHFFGLVITGGAFFALIVHYWSAGLRPTPLIVALAATAIMSAGLIPFIVASVGMSHPTADALTLHAKLTDLIRLGYRTVGHASTAVNTVMNAFCLLGAALSLASALASALKKPTEDKTGLVIALFSGLFVVTAAHFAQSGFNASASSYNVWILPGLALLLASGVTGPARNWRQIAWLGLGLLLTADVYGVAQLAIHGEYFSHTPHRSIANLVKQLDPAEVAIVYDEPPLPSEIWHIYAPLRYEFGASFRQFSFVGMDSAGAKITSYPNGENAISLNSLPFRYILVIRAKEASSADVAEQIRHGVPPVGGGPVIESLSRSGPWTRIEAATFGSYVATDVTIFRNNISTGK